MKPRATATDRTRSKRLRSGVVGGGGLAGALLVSACSLVFDPEPREFQDYGERCSQNYECASGSCVDSRCSQSCSDTCPPGAGDVEIATCKSGVCDFNAPPPLLGAPAIAFLYNGAVQVEEDVYSGTVTAHDDARNELAQEFDAETRGVENISSATAQGTIDDLVAEGYNVIIGTSEVHRTAVTTAANRYRDVNFLQVGAYIDFEAGYNVGSFSGRMYSATYLLGQAAAEVTETNRIGVVAPVALPETVASINAFARGALKVSPSVDVVVRWINNWESKTLEPQAVEELAAADCDVIFGYTDTTRPLIHAVNEIETTASGEQITVIGYGTSDICETDPRIGSRCLSVAFWNWEPMLTDMVSKMLNGTWVPARYWEPMGNDRTQSVAHYTSFNVGILDFAQSMDINGQVDDLARDPLLPFAGTIRDTNGTSHADIDDDDLMGMCWHVEGIMRIESLTPEVVLEPLTEVPASCRSF